MKVNKITVYYSSTVQMRQFEPTVLSVSVEAQLDPGDEFARTFKRVYKQAEAEIEEQIKVKKQKRKESFLEEEGLEKVA